MFFFFFIKGYVPFQLLHFPVFQWYEMEIFMNTMCDLIDISFIFKHHNEVQCQWYASIREFGKQEYHVGNATLPLKRFSSISASDDELISLYAFFKITLPTKFAENKIKINCSASHYLWFIVLCYEPGVHSYFSCREMALWHSFTRDKLITACSR